MVTGFGVLGGLLAVLLALAPVYLENYRFSRYVKEQAAAAAAGREDDLRSRIRTRAAEMGLAVQDGDIRVTQANGHAAIQIRYAVHVDMGLYRVDLHFHPEAAGR